MQCADRKWQRLLRARIWLQCRQQAAADGALRHRLLGWQRSARCPQGCMPHLCARLSLCPSLTLVCMLNPRSRAIRQTSQPSRSACSTSAAAMETACGVAGLAWLQLRWPCRPLCYSRNPLVAELRWCQIKERESDFSSSLPPIVALCVAAVASARSRRSAASVDSAPYRFIA